MKRKPLRSKKKMPDTDRKKVRPRAKNPWLTTWRRLIPETTFDTLDELGQFLHEQGLHTGDIPSAEAFRMGLAKNKDGKFYWHLGKCMRFLRRHDKSLTQDDYER